MRVLLATVAVLVLAAIPATPAEAQSFVSQGVTVHGGNFTGSPGNRHDRRRNRGFEGDIVVGGWGWDGTWALYNNRSFAPDSYNDWWHERPWRSYPRWVTDGTCDRMWWSGGGWRC